RLHALDEEVVVAREAVLRVDPVLVRDRGEVELPVHVVVGDEQLPYRTTPVGVGAEGGQPEPRERPPQPDRHENPEGPPGHAPRRRPCDPSWLPKTAHPASLSTNPTKSCAQSGSRCSSA